MAGSLMPCGSCSRHVRTSERSCPFCGGTLALSEPIKELRLLTRLDRSRMFALGALLSAAGIALGCREQQVVAVYGAPPTPLGVPSARPSAEPPPPTSQQTAAPTASGAPIGVPAAVYGVPPPRMPEPGSGPPQR